MFWKARGERLYPSHRLRAPCGLGTGTRSWMVVSTFGGHRGRDDMPRGTDWPALIPGSYAYAKEGKTSLSKKVRDGFPRGYQRFPGEALIHFSQNEKGFYLLKWLLQWPICLIPSSPGPIIAGNEAFKMNSRRAESIFPALSSSRGNASESSSPGPLPGKLQQRVLQ